MEAQFIEESKEERGRYNQRFVLRNLEDPFYNWYLCIYKDKYKLPKLVGDYDLSEKEKVDKSIDLLIKVIEKNLETFSKDEFVKNEFLKVVYEHIKIEICHSLNRTSKLLEVSKEYGLDIESLVRKDIENIKCSTYVDSEMLEYFKRTLKIHDNILNPNVIKSIVMCTNYELIRKGNKAILDNSYQSLKETNYEDLKENIKTQNKIVKKRLKEKRKDFIRTSLIGTLMVLTIGASILGFKPISNIASYNAGTIITYKTTTESYTSLGNFNETEEYMDLSIESPKVTLTIYGEPYEVNGELLRKIEKYNVKDFETTSDLEKYYNIDFDSLLIEPFFTNTQKLEEDDSLEKYIEVSRITQDKESPNEEQNKRYYVEILIVLCLALVGIAFIPLGIEYIKLRRSLEFLDVSKTLYNDETYKLILLINKCKKILEENGYTLSDAIKLCDEIVGRDSYDDLGDEYKKTIETYKKIRDEHSELIELLKTSDYQNIKIKKKK